LQAVFFFVQLWFIRREIDRAEKTFLFANSPLLKIKFVELTLINDNNIEVNFGIVNAGTTAAEIIGSAAYVEVFEPDEWPNPHNCGRNTVIGNRRFLPGATDRYTIDSKYSSPLTVPVRRESR
jgi:hypothetical protein